MADASGALMASEGTAHRQLTTTRLLGEHLEWAENDLEHKRLFLFWDSMCCKFLLTCKCKPLSNMLTVRPVATHGPVPCTFLFSYG